MKLERCAALVLAFAVLSAPALAFNGKRKGFVLGGGVGGAYLAYNEGGWFDLDKFSLATNFKIGYAPSESLEIYYVNSVSWFGYSSETFVIGASCVGITKYLNREGKGIFLFGGVGLASFYALSGDSGSANGFGVLGGVGYDIGRHWSIQGDVLYTNLESGMASSVSFRVSINFLAF